MNDFNFKLRLISIGGYVLFCVPKHTDLPTINTKKIINTECPWIKQQFFMDESTDSWCDYDVILGTYTKEDMSANRN